MTTFAVNNDMAFPSRPLPCVTDGRAGGGSPGGAERELRLRLWPPRPGEKPRCPGADRWHSHVPGAGGGGALTTALPTAARSVPTVWACAVVAGPLSPFKF